MNAEKFSGFVVAAIAWSVAAIAINLAAMPDNHQELNRGCLRAQCYECSGLQEEKQHACICSGKLQGMLFACDSESTCQSLTTVTACGLR